VKKILYVVTEDWYFWSHRLALAHAARKEGYEVYVVTKSGEFAVAITAEGFRLYPLAINRSVGTLATEFLTLFRIFRAYREIKPDIVHHIALKPVVMGSVAAWFARVPVVVNSYTGLGFLFISESTFSRLFRRFLLPLLSCFLKGSSVNNIVQNTSDRDLLISLGLVLPDHTSLIRGSGVDMRIFNYTHEVVTDRPIVLFASRLLRDKGISEFIDAATILKTAGCSARFVIAGDTDPGNPTSTSHKLVEQWVADGLIEWWGHRLDMPSVFSQVNIVCLPSYREGLPKVLLEAAACGRAIVTTDVPGCSDVVVEGVNGLRVPVRNSVRLADAIRTLVDSAELRNKMGLAGRKYVEANFDVDAVNVETVSLYNKLCKK
jgi:glycosyltransferase involved in cell wall biosynthesis